MNRPSLAFLLALVPAAFLHAQTSPPPCAFPAGNCAWSIDISYHAKGQSGKEAAAARPRRVKIEATRGGDVSHYKTTWSNKRITEDWLVGDFVFHQDEVSGEVSVIPKGGSLQKYDRFDQSLFDWVPAGEVKAERKGFLGKTCIQVRKEMDDASTPGEKPPRFLQAWMDAQTHIPVAFDDGQALYAFTFQPPPTAPLVLPRQYQDEQARYEKALTPPKRLGN